MSKPLDANTSLKNLPTPREFREQKQTESSEEETEKKQEEIKTVGRSKEVGSVNCCNS